jgi:hypothetical protein
MIVRFEGLDNEESRGTFKEGGSPRPQNAHGISMQPRASGKKKITASGHEAVRLMVCTKLSPLIQNLFFCA